MELNKKAYGDYVKKVTPVNGLLADMGKAFVTGGVICAGAQILILFLISRAGLEKEKAQTLTQLTLIFLSALSTGLGIYPKIVKWGGAGALVPITGFANSVSAPAIEYRTEGHVFGIGVKIFTIAGPVILYGVLASWILGLIFLIGKFLGFI